MACQVTRTKKDGRKHVFVHHYLQNCLMGEAIDLFSSLLPRVTGRAHPRFRVMGSEQVYCGFYPEVVDFLHALHLSYSIIHRESLQLE